MQVATQQQNVHHHHNIRQDQTTALNNTTNIPPTCQGASTISLLQVNGTPHDASHPHQPNLAPPTAGHQRDMLTMPISPLLMHPTQGERDSQRPLSPGEHFASLQKEEAAPSPPPSFSAAQQLVYRPDVLRPAHRILWDASVQITNVSHSTRAGLGLVILCQPAA